MDISSIFDLVSLFSALIAIGLWPIAILDYFLASKIDYKIDHDARQRLPYSVWYRRSLMGLPTWRMINRAATTLDEAKRIVATEVADRMAERQRRIAVKGVKTTTVWRSVDKL